jgi:putative flippase GtrA
MSAQTPAERVVVIGSAPPREHARILRFGVVGVVNCLVTLAVFTVLTALGCPAPAAAAIGFAAGAVNSFVCNSRWTFGDLAPAARAWWRFAAIQGLGALASAAGVGALTARGWPHLAAECAILPLVAASLYCLSRLFVFRAPAS